MTRDEARADAQAAANHTGKPVDIWEHVGGRNAKGVILPQGRFIITTDGEDRPKYVWQKVETVKPSGRGA